MNLEIIEASVKLVNSVAINLSHYIFICIFINIYNINKYNINKKYNSKYILQIGISLKKKIIFFCSCFLN